MPNSPKPRRAAGFLSWLFGRGGLKRTILVPFVFLILLGFGIGWTVYVRGSRSAVLGTVDLLAHEAASRIRDRFTAYLGAASDAVTINAALIGSLGRPELRASELSQAFRLQLLALEEVELLNVGFADGEYVEAQRLPEGRIRLGRAGRETGGDLVISGSDEAGRLLAEEQRLPAYVPSARPWYRSAADSGGSAWTAPYALLSSGELAMAASMPIRLEGRLLGVVSANLRLGALSDFLASLSEIRGGYAYVVDEAGRLVAASDGRPLADPGSRTRHGLQVHGGPAELLHAALPPGRETANLSIGGERFRAIRASCAVDPGLDWSILLALPTSGFLAPIAALDLSTAFVILGTLAGALLLAFVSAHRISRPIRALGRAVAALEPAAFGHSPSAPLGGEAAPEPAEAAVEEVGSLADRDDEIGRLARAFAGLLGRLEESFVSLRSSLQEKEILLKEVHHRVKNNLQIVSSLLSLQASTSGDPALRASFEGLQDRLHAMAFVHEDMYGSGNFSSVRMDTYLEKICDSLSLSRFGERDLHVAVEARELILPLDKALPCGLIVSELVTNALRHAFDGRDSGRVLVRLESEGASCLLSVSDDGIGMESARPARPGGIGSSLVAGLASQLKARLETESGPGGTRVNLSFPL